MRDFIGVLLVLLFTFGVLALIVFLGYQFNYYILSLVGIVISAIGIILFIKYFPGRHTPDKKRDADKDKDSGA